MYNIFDLLPYVDNNFALNKIVDTNQYNLFQYPVKLITKTYVQITFQPLKFLHFKINIFLFVIKDTKTFYFKIKFNSESRSKASPGIQERKSH